MVTIILSALARIKADVATHLQAAVIERLCGELGYTWRDRILTPVVTIHAFLLQVLHGNTCRSLDQVVQAGEHQNSSTYDSRRDVAEVGEGRVLGRRQVADDPNERALRVKRPVNRHQVVLCEGGFGLGVDRGEDSPVHRYEVGREDHLDRMTAPGGGLRQYLVDLGSMTMPAHAVGRKVFVTLRKMKGQLGRPARA